ncbi:cytochrome P450 [Immersiella caudata]|uniref:Cytochrome P450 n=1 Tax=Immersiella caudata TaxID=314043 RepID=A0AA40C3R0_9PEZI|nr:cytochrome P450 [Immersiella caudata]
MRAARSPYTRTKRFNQSTRLWQGKDHVFSLLSEEEHLARRARMAAGCSGKENLSLESSIDVHIEERIALIRSNNVGFGKPFGDVKADRDLNDYLEAEETGLAVLLQWPTPPAKVMGLSEKGLVSFGRMFATARELVHDRLKRDTSGKSDMFAPSFATRGGGIISDAEARNLTYMQAVIKEGMRVHPPVTTTIGKRVPDRGDTVVINGKLVFLPGGVNDSQATLAVQHNKRVFGEDVADFRQERWLLEKDERKLAEMNRANELNFGYGRYQCLGKSIAMMEIGKTVFEVG